MAKYFMSFLGTAVLGVVVVAIVVSDVGFVIQSTRTTAVVENVTLGMRSGLRMARVRIDKVGRPTWAEMRVWYTRLAVGERIPVRFRSEDRRTVLLDRPEHLFYRSAIGLLVLAVLATVETSAFRARRQALLRRGGLLGD